MKLRVDRRSVHPAEKDEAGIVEALVRCCNLSDEELAELLERCGKEVVYWTASAKDELLDFWVEDDDERVYGPFSCTAVEEASTDYTLTESAVRLAAVEHTLIRYYEQYSQACDEAGARWRALREVESELRNDLERATKKREFLEDANRGGVERLSGMEEAFQIALNRIETHKPKT